MNYLVLLTNKIIYSKLINMIKIGGICDGGGQNSLLRLDLSSNNLPFIQGYHYNYYIFYS